MRLLLTDPKLCYEVYTNLATAHQFRLVGPRAWSGARQAVLGITDRLKYPVLTGISYHGQRSVETGKQMYRKMMFIGLLAIVGFCILAWLLPFKISSIF